jgi:hypothetical protein
MKNTLALIILLLSSSIGACARQKIESPVLPPTPTMEPLMPPLTELPAHNEDNAQQKTYDNDLFGLQFYYPDNWFGPDEFVMNRNLRVEVGSDKVFPYGTGLEERVYEIRNSYYVTVQYSEDDQDPYWKDIYQSLLSLHDGESVTDMHNTTTRIRQVDQGAFLGIEYITTPAAGALTEPFLLRQIIMFNQQSNDLLVVTGQPMNVDLVDSSTWLDSYQAVDEAHLDDFRAIVGSIRVSDS